MQRLIFLIAYFFVSTGSFAQPASSGGQHPFVHYTPKDGLVNSRVRKAYQDSKGRMYFLTYSGLSMYDGARFRNYTTQNGLLNDMVNDVLEVGDDSLLVAVNTCGLNILVRGQMKQSHISNTVCPVVNQLLKSNNGNIYASGDNGLYKINKNEFEKLSTVIPGQKEPAAYLGAIAEYKDFLVFTTNDLRDYRGLYLYNKKENKITDVLPELFIHSLKSDHKSLVWLSTNNLIAVLDTQALASGKLELRKPYDPFINPAELSPGSIIFNRQNELFISSSGKGIVRHRKEGARQHITLPEQSGISAQNFFIDSEDVLWICHDGTGVYKLPDTKLQSVVSYTGDNESGIKLIRSNTPDTCWVVTNNGRLILHTSIKTKTFTVVPAITFNSLFYDDKYLYGVTLHKLYRAALPTDNETAIRFKQIFTLPDSIFFGGRFVNDPYGNLILFESGNILVLQNDKILFTYSVSPFDLIEGMHIDKKNQLWVISRGNTMEVFSLHPEDPGHYLRKKIQFVKEFENASPRCITVDKNELLWMGARYNGLMAFEYKNNQLIKRFHFSTENGLTDNFITSLACDKNNNIIVGTQTGLDRLIKTKDNYYRVENVTKSNNVFFYIREVWTNADNKAFALTSAGGVLEVEPVLQGGFRYKPQLFITEIKINGKPSPDFRFPLRLHYQQRNITFSVASPAFLDERQIKYTYRLSGSGNKEWSDTTSVADINLLNLIPGNYALQVKAFFNSTAYEPKELTCSFIILPPWWQTGWFRGAAGLLIIGLLILGIRFYYRRKLEKQKTILEKQQAVEKERTRIATDMHDDLGAGLSTIRFLSEKVKRNSFSDVTKGDAEKIVINSNDLVQKMNEIIWAMNEKNDTLEDLLFYTRSYAAEYCEENNLTCQTSLPAKIPSAFVSGEIRRNVFLTVKESLHNIVKHANAAKVTIDFNINSTLSVTVKDDGKGFSDNGKNNGNGLRNMQKRMESVKGSFEIINRNGIMVKIKVPLQL